MLVEADDGSSTSLVREDGSIEEAWNDWPKVRVAMRWAEDRYGLRATADVGMGTPGTSRAEHERVGVGEVDVRAKLRALVHAEKAQSRVERFDDWLPSDDDRSCAMIAFGR